MCKPVHALKTTSKKFWIIFDISNIRLLLGIAQKHICNIIEEIVFRNCTFLLLSKTISSIMFQICFRANHSQDRVFKTSKIIQNNDYKYISGHILPCTQNCHLNSISTHCAPHLDLPINPFFLLLPIRIRNEGLLMYQNWQSKMNRLLPDQGGQRALCSGFNRTNLSAIWQYFASIAQLTFIMWNS